MRKAKTRGVKNQLRKEQEDGEGKQQPLTAAPSALRFVEVGTPVARRPLTDPGGRYFRTLCGAPHKVRYVVNLVMW